MWMLRGLGGEGKGGVVECERRNRDTIPIVLGGVLVFEIKVGGPRSVAHCLHILASEEFGVWRLVVTNLATHTPA